MKIISFTLLLFIANISAFKIPQFWPDRYNSTNLQRIIGGQNAARYQFPHQVAVFTNPSGSFCGGSVISATCVLTAAHCIKQPSSTVNPYTDVIFGVLDLFDTSSAEPDRVMRTATSVLPHASFSFSAEKYDIGLVFFSAVTLGTAIAAIALPYSACNSYVDADVSISGWGLTSDSATTPSEILQYVDTTVIDKSSCQDQLPSNTIEDEHICTDGNPTGSDEVGGCHGDSGGPLTTLVWGVPTLIGVVSFGSPAGCETGAPTVFTRTTTYLSWINANKT